jgi:hypothetical protein
MQYVGWFLILICLHVIINGHPNVTDWIIFAVGIVLVLPSMIKFFKEEL